jgi:hypothetical protein
MYFEGMSKVFLVLPYSDMASVPTLFEATMYGIKMQYV